MRPAGAGVQALIVLRRTRASSVRVSMTNGPISPRTMISKDCKLQWTLSSIVQFVHIPPSCSPHTTHSYKLPKYPCHACFVVATRTACACSRPQTGQGGSTVNNLVLILERLLPRTWAVSLFFAHPNQSINRPKAPLSPHNNLYYTASWQLDYPNGQKVRMLSFNGCCLLILYNEALPRG